MMGEPIAMLCWGAMIGWCVSRWRIEPARPPALTREHEVGARMMNIVREMVETQRFTLRFTGHVVPIVKRWRTPSRFGTIEVVMRLHDDEPA
jgi:hypothetical protein